VSDQVQSPNATVIDPYPTPGQPLDPYAARPDDPNALQLLDPYPGTKIARHVELAIVWQSKNIARDLAPHLRALSYADNLSGAADDLSIEVEDRDSLWSGDWRPTKGDSVVVRLSATPWLTKVDSLRLGKFSHDKITISGPPRRAVIKAVSAPLATGLRRRKRTRSWNGRTLKGIAQDVADRAGLSLLFDGDEGRKYENRAQSDKSDLEFIEELCKDVGRTLKVTEDQIAIFDELTRDSAASVGELDLIGGKVLSWEVDSDDSNRYGSCVITFSDPTTGKTHRGQFPPAGQTLPDLDPDGQTLEIRMPLSSIGEAAERAKALLRNANRFATSGTITIIGDPGLVAGVTFDLVNAFGFDGKFIITKAEHHPVGGYTCTLTVRRCLEGF
jgi:hypothetical protein